MMFDEQCCFARDRIDEVDVSASAVHLFMMLIRCSVLIVILVGLLFGCGLFPRALLPPPRPVPVLPLAPSPPLAVIAPGFPPAPF